MVIKNKKFNVRDKTQAKLKTKYMFSPLHDMIYTKL